MSDTDPQVLTTLSPSQPRRVFAVAVSAMLGLLLLWVAVAAPPRDPAFLVLLLGLGGAALWSAFATLRATRDTLMLTEEALITSSGQEICRVDHITSVDRSVFAFKPAGGFLLRLNTPYRRVWAPGLWWRMGKRVGVGGVTRAAEARIMADLLTAMVAEAKRLR